MKERYLQRTGAALAIAALCLTPPQAMPQSTATTDTNELHIQQSAYATPLPFDRGTAGLAQSLKKLATRATLLQINAHPDDEDGPMLTYESRGMGAVVSLLALNRGEGGQNVMTGDFWDGLGILRTQEHLAANHYYDVNLYYTRVADFGFSKTREETLKQWGHDRVLADAVRVVRETRPMVITSVFAGNVSDGHGHHQTAGVTAQEVFKAAGDPAVFPEQIKEGLRPWTALKVYGRVPFARATKEGVFDYATGKTEPLLYRNYVTGDSMYEVPPATVNVPAGTYNPLFGESYAQIAREGLNQQKSQNGGVALPPPGPADSKYHLYASRVGAGKAATQEASFFDGIDTSLPAIALALPRASQAPVHAKLLLIASQVREATRLFDANDPAKSAPALAKGLELTRALIASLRKAALPEDARYNAVFELETKERQFNTALGQALSISMLATVEAPPNPQRATEGPLGRGPQPTSQTVIPGEAFGVNVHLVNQGRAALAVDAISLVSIEGDWKCASAKGKTMASGEAVDNYLPATVPADAKPTGPYFSRTTIEQSYYDLQDPRWLTMPTEPYPLSAHVDYTFAGTRASVSGVVQTSHRYNGIGTVQEPLLVAPPISVQVAPSSGVLPLSATSLALQVTVHSSVKGPARGTLQLQLPTGWSSEPATASFHTTRDNEDVVLPFHVKTPGLAAQKYQITAAADFNGKQYTSGFTTIGYPGIRPYPRYEAATNTVTGVDVKVAPHLKVGYVMGSGDDVADSLRQIGIEPILISDAELQRADLSSYDCILLGVRTYTARPVLRAANSRLLDYVRRGGVVITQYQSAEFDHDYAPYPLSVPGDQGHTVVEEDAPVTLLRPDDPLMKWPNQIGPVDFQNWVEERGHGFPKSFAPEFVALTQTHDGGQDPQTGGLIYARYGKGYYVYLAFAFFREMPEGVPGSFRVMANLLSVSKNPDLK